MTILDWLLLAALIVLALRHWNITRALKAEIRAEQNYRNLIFLSVPDEAREKVLIQITGHLCEGRGFSAQLEAVREEKLRELSNMIKGKGAR